MRKIIIVLALLLVASTARAQGVPATVAWNQAEGLSVAQSYSYNFKVDTGAPVTLAATCSSVNGATSCSAPISNYVVGVHTIVLTACNTSGGCSSATATTVAPPSTPTGLKVIVVIVGDNEQ